MGSVRHSSAVAAANGDAVVELRDVVVGYGAGPTSSVALTIDRLTIEPGTSTVITGPSGSGKSTLLRVLARLQTPSAGEVAHPRGGSAMTVYQDHRLVPFLTVGENVRLAADLHARHHANTKHVTSHLERLGVAQLINRYPTEISGGESQRVAIAQALIAEPVLLLADEPTGALDGVNANQVGSILASLCDSGSAVVVATHDLAVASYFENRVELRTNQ